MTGFCRYQDFHCSSDPKKFDLCRRISNPVDINYQTLNKPRIFHINQVRERISLKNSLDYGGF